jgi:hypothetical protein
MVYPNRLFPPRSPAFENLSMGNVQEANGTKHKTYCKNKNTARADKSSSVRRMGCPSCVPTRRV